MPLKVGQWTIDKVAVLDDDEDSRETMCDDLRLANFSPAAVEAAPDTEDALLETITRNSHGAVCDYRLRDYAPCSGAQAVNRLYQAKFPAVLVTRYFKADVDEIRPYRRRIPALLTPEQASEDPEAIARGFELCIREFDEDFAPSRRPWRTLLRVEDVEDVDQTHKDPMVYVILPGWNSREVVRFPRSIIPAELHEFLQPGARLFATVNKGAEDQLELYFEGFEYRGS